MTLPSHIHSPINSRLVRPLMYVRHTTNNCQDNIRDFNRCDFCSQEGHGDRPKVSPVTTMSRNQGSLVVTRNVQGNSCPPIYVLSGVGTGGNQAELSVSSHKTYYATLFNEPSGGASTVGGRGATVPRMTGHVHDHDCSKRANGKKGGRFA